LSPGQRIAQAVHAAFEFAVDFPDITAHWARASNFLVVLECASDADLQRLKIRAELLNLHYKLVIEPDYPADRSTTAIVLEPGEMSSRLCSSFPLALKESPVAA
jgi:hypothetical protein